MSETDPIDKLFAELDSFYPGSKKKRRADTESTKTQKTLVESSWDSRPYKKSIHGNEVEMFTIGALAKALGKSEISVRLWQRKGYIPDAPYRLPSTTVGDSTIKGRRLYTRAMVEAAISAFSMRNLLEAPRIEWSEHSDLSQEIQLAWKEIQENLKSNDPGN